MLYWLNLKKVIKLSKHISLKEKLTTLRIQEAQKFIDDFNYIADKTNKNWEAIILRFAKPHSLEVNAILKSRLKNLKKDYNKELFELSILVTQYLHNLSYVENNYSLKATQNITTLKAKLDTVLKMNFDILEEYLLQNKLPNI